MKPREWLTAESQVWRVVSFLVTIAATAAIVSTYRVFNNMYDEPAHVAAGMEWLSRGTYTYEPQHPPLSRIMCAIGPWLAGERSHGEQHMYPEGRAILGRGAHYQRMLALARMGQLPFFLVIAFVAWYWTRRLSNERTAALAVLFVTTNPNLLAHAGVAGNDIGPAAMMPAALLALVLWLKRPSTGRGVLLGVALALCALTKFSAMAFWLPAAAVTLYSAALRHRQFSAALRPGSYSAAAAPRVMAGSFAVALLTTALTVWATYRFSIGQVAGMPVPAPELWTGLRDFFRHGTGGHPAYLLGEVRIGGWWYYDLVAVLVKTPIPLLVFGATGIIVAAAELRRTRRKAPAEYETGRRPAENTQLQVALLAGVASVLVVSSAAAVDIGIRLALALYPLLAVLAALGMSWVWTRARQSSSRFLVAALGAWMVIEVVATHPDHIAYFNAFAGRNPERVLVDSNLDWGQDLYRLRDATNELGIDSLRVHYFGTAEFAAVGLERARRLRPQEQVTGWVAASETFYAGVWSGTALDWLREHTPVARVGRSIRLYHIPPGEPR